MQMSHATEIQLLYPQEPHWQDVPDPVLIELVQSYFQEPSCATIAIGLLHSRGKAEAHTLAQWLLAEDGADQWLKAAAADVLGQPHA
jgi:hypothetical protein